MLGIGGGMALPAVMAMAVVIGGEKNALGTVIAILTAAESLGMVIGPILGGLAMDALGATAAFSGCAIFMFFATITVLFQTGVKAPLVEESDLKTSSPERL